MQGAFSFATLVLLAGVLTQASGHLGAGQTCVFNSDGEKSTKFHTDSKILPMSVGGIVRIYVEHEQNLVVGSDLLFCDDQIDEVTIQLADDRKSYIVHRPTDSEQPSFYIINVYEDESETRRYRAQASRKSHPLVRGHRYH